MVDGYTTHARLALLEERPSKIDSYPGAADAWYASAALRARQRARPHEFTTTRRGGCGTGWTWRGSPDTVIRDLMGPHKPDRVIRAIRRYLTETGNLVDLRPEGEGAAWWLPEFWQDIDPATARRLADEEAATSPEAELAALALARPARPVVAETVGIRPDEVGAVTSRDETVLCRWCPAHAPASDQAALTTLRVHERDDHPAAFWGTVTHVCVQGRCEYGAAGPDAFTAHLVLAHTVTLPAIRAAITPQAAARAAALRPARPAPAPVPAPPRAIHAVPAPPRAAPQAAAPAEPGSIAAAVHAAEVLTGAVRQLAALQASNLALTAERDQWKARAIAAERGHAASA
jgi:hypothetical protein